MMRHVIKIDSTSATLCRTDKMILDNKEMEFNYDGKKLYWGEISEPLMDDMDMLEYHGIRQNRKDTARRHTKG